MVFLRMEVLQFNCTFWFYWSKSSLNPVWECAWEDYITRSALAETRLFGTIERCLSHLSSSEQDHGEKVVLCSAQTYTESVTRISSHHTTGSCPLFIIHSKSRKIADLAALRATLLTPPPLKITLKTERREEQWTRHTEKCMRVSQQLRARSEIESTINFERLGNKWFWGAQVAALRCLQQEQKTWKTSFQAHSTGFSSTSGLHLLIICIFYCSTGDKFQDLPPRRLLY